MFLQTLFQTLGDSVLLLRNRLGELVEGIPHLFLEVLLLQVSLWHRALYGIYSVRDISQLLAKHLVIVALFTQNPFARLGCFAEGLNLLARPAIHPACHVRQALQYARGNGIHLDRIDALDLLLIAFKHLGEALCDVSLQRRQIAFLYCSKGRILQALCDSLNFPEYPLGLVAAGAQNF